MLRFIGGQRKGKAAGRNTQLAVDLEPYLCGCIIYRCFHSANRFERKVRNVGIYDNVPVVIVGTVHTLPDSGDVQALRHRFYCAIGVGL